MPVREVAPNIYWVGAIDWDIRYFHGPAYSTHRGTTYNAYLIIDDEVALVDTVYTPFATELLRNIAEVIDPARIAHVICNHSEIDHSGALPLVMDTAKGAKLHCTAKGAEFLTQQFHRNWQYNLLKTFDEVKLGARTLTFLEAPMLHWPDSMFTYVKEDAILMPNDAFGQHYASSGRFDDEVDMAIVMQEATKYYANILTPFSRLVAKKLQEVADLKLPLSQICPSHGVIFRHDPGRILQAYQDWSQEPNQAKVVIAYDTMWESTAKMANAIAAGVAARGVEYQLFRISQTDRNDLITAIQSAKAVAIGSPTINRGMLATVAPLLDDLAGLKPTGKTAVAFGSEGWGGGSVAAINHHLQRIGWSTLHDGVSMRWNPKEGEIASLVKLGHELADAAKL